MTNAGLGALNRCLNIENLRRRGKVTVDQCVGELLLSADEFEPVRLELAAARVVRVQSLPRRHEHEEYFL
jgi:hypothetical protein